MEEEAEVQRQEKAALHEAEELKRRIEAEWEVDRRRIWAELEAK